jgi:protein-S-isoprenylcysteine O-methyltransferase Ste14
MPNNRRAMTATIWRSVVGTGVFFAFLIVGMFLPAGDVGWMRGWLLVLAFIVLTIPSVVYLRRTNPEIFFARSRFHEGTKSWDKVLVAILLLSLAAELPIAALDAGRFRWSHAALWVIVLGYVLLSAGYFISVWAYRVNKFAEPGVRIQTDRGQKVIDTGPYAIVRHPVYVGGLLLAVGIPLALGSFWALVPAAVGSLTILVRIAWEEQTLREELAGYNDYASRVRYRLIPGIW